MTILSPFLSIILSLSLSFILPTLINLFKNTFHSFLDFPGALGLITAIRRVKSTPPSSPSIKTDLDHIDIGVGVVDGFTSCTEILGFESAEDTRVDDEDDQRVRGNWRKICNYVKKEVKTFPPLSSLNRNGQPCFFLRPVRKDGRLELTEVRIHRPEILHIWRHDGRLTLHLIPDESIPEEEEIGEITSEEEEEGVGIEEWKFGKGGNEIEGLRSVLPSGESASPSAAAAYVWNGDCVRMRPELKGANYEWSR